SQERRCANYQARAKSVLGRIPRLFPGPGRTFMGNNLESAGIGGINSTAAPALCLTVYGARRPFSTAIRSLYSFSSISPLAKRSARISSGDFSMAFPYHDPPAQGPPRQPWRCHHGRRKKTRIRNKIAKIPNQGK